MNYDFFTVRLSQQTFMLSSSKKKPREIISKIGVGQAWWQPNEPISVGDI
jgi:hypothetical protein